MIEYLIWTGLAVWVAWTAADVVYSTHLDREQERHFREHYRKRGGL